MPDFAVFFGISGEVDDRSANPRATADGRLGRCRLGSGKQRGRIAVHR
jgi:hypothetical protein